MTKEKKKSKYQTFNPYKDKGVRESVSSLSRLRIVQHDVVAFETALNSKSQVSTYCLPTYCVCVCVCVPPKRLARSSSLTKLGGARPVIEPFSHLSNRYTHTHELVVQMDLSSCSLIIQYIEIKEGTGQERAQLPVRSDKYQLGEKPNNISFCHVAPRRARTSSLPPTNLSRCGQTVRS